MAKPHRLVRLRARRFVRKTGGTALSPYDLAGRSPLSRACFGDRPGGKRPASFVASTPGRRQWAMPRACVHRLRRRAAVHPRRSHGEGSAALAWNVLQRRHRRRPCAACRYLAALGEKNKKRGGKGPGCVSRFRVRDQAFALPRDIAFHRRRRAVHPAELERPAAERGAACLHQKRSSAQGSGF